MTVKFREHFGIAVRGLAMGAADIVPGVSGGTIAFITGIYERLLESLSNINFSLITTLRKAGLRAAWDQIHGGFLLTLFTGILISIFSLATIIRFFLEHHAHLLWSFFFGLVGASIWFVGKQVGNWGGPRILAFVIGAVVAYAITTIPPLGTADQLWYILLCGAIAICAMILPGISGSFILLLLGAYPVVIQAISDLNITILGTFAAGCVIGLLLFSKLLNWMFKHHKHTTIASLTGFLLGSMPKIWPWKQNVELLYTHSDGREEWLQTNVLPGDFSPDPQVMLCVALAVLGFGLILLMERIAIKN